MTKLAQITLAIAREVTEVLGGTASTGTNKALTDTVRLTQQNQYWDRGTLWILSGAQDGKVRRVTGFSSNQLDFDDIGSALCTQQVETATVAGSVTGDGNASVTVTAAGMNNSPKTISVAVLNGDTASAAATKIRTALAADADVSAWFDIGGSSAAVTLTANAARANDTTLNVAIDNGTCTGLTAAPTSANTTAGVAGPSYAVALPIYPYTQIVQAVNEALNEIRVTEEDESLTGDGETLEFSLPAGVDNVKNIEIEDVGDATRQFPSHHWKLRGGKIRFDYGYAPADGDIIHLFYKTDHNYMTDVDDTIHEDVNIYWLKWKGVEQLLYWGMKQYGDAKEYRIEELMNKALARQKSAVPTSLEFTVKTAGG